MDLRGCIGRSEPSRYRGHAHKARIAMRATIHRGVRTVACSSLLLLSLLRAAGQGTLDQAFDPPPPNPYYLGGNILSSLNGTFVDQAQTFTVGIAGSLGQLQVLVRQELSASLDLLVDIRP